MLYLRHCELRDSGIEGLRDWSPLSEPGNTFVAKLEMINHIVAFCALKP
jgi:hypothetical protein